MLLAGVGKGKRVEDFIAGLAGREGQFEGSRLRHGAQGHPQLWQQKGGRD